MPNKVRSANQGTRYVSRLSTLFLNANVFVQVLETVTKQEKRNRKDLALCSLISAWPGTPDCPVRPTTEGKDGLPDLFSTAPSCLGAIKGTPRRMEEDTKHSYNIPKHQDIDSTHLVHCDSI